MTPEHTVLRVCRVLGAAVVGALAVTALTPASQELAARYVEHAQLEPSDAIVVLGGGSVGGSLGDASLQRVVQGIHLQRLGLAPVLVFTGETPPVGPSEPEIGARFARDLGVPAAAIVTVSGTTTRQEAIGVGAALRPRGVRSVLLVSGSLHLVRARGVFEREGFQVRPAPADSLYTHGSVARHRLDVTRALVRELAGWLYYRLAGYL